MEDFRKLVTIRTIDGLFPIDGADAIEVAQVDGWKVVVKKGDFSVGDACCYFEIDSFLPDGNPAWQFLVDKQPKMMDGLRGHRLRTIKLRGQTSQGFVLHISALPVVQDFMQECAGPVVSTSFDGSSVDFVSPYGVDLSDLVGVKKFEAPLPAALAGQAEGLFPSFIRKTDQERCQNLHGEIFGYEDQVIPANEKLGRPEIIRPAKAQRNARYEVTVKLDGSSMTAFVRASEQGPKVGVCSRNLELKISEANAGNSFVHMLEDTKLDSALVRFHEQTGREIAVQGELMGPSIQGNREALVRPTLYVFDIYDIQAGLHVGPVERRQILNVLREIAQEIQHIPVLHESITLDELGITNIDELLKFAEGPSVKHAVREGVVLKRLDGEFSFKAISQKFLLAEK